MLCGSRRRGEFWSGVGNDRLNDRSNHEGIVGLLDENLLDPVTQQCVLLTPHAACEHRLMGRS